MNPGFLFLFLLLAVFVSVSRSWRIDLENDDEYSDVLIGREYDGDRPVRVPIHIVIINGRMH